ncbi:Serine/threonine protein kinase [Pandoravirus salinus]|uniref:non-specific serine/threonine protein kinase n=1 Tax=Pandoravirus salinus TaxID=1349410 RepID=S4VYW6_9VIRU|nr:serine-threonine kinase [Pandoravirus salinus]AGO85889.2 Serine/threonine protein kinase [Pandoravirus salinus]
MDVRTTRHHVATLWVLFLVISAACAPCAAAVGVRLNGSGTKSAGLLFDVLTRGYAFVRDDVALRYDAVGSLVSTTRSMIQDFDVYELPIDIGLTVMFNITQLPLAGQAVVMAYHLPGFDPAVDPPLVFDRATLAAIWAGNVSTWNHPAIAALNPEIAARLPAANITLGYIDDFYLSAAEVVKLSLESFSPAFASQFAACNRTFGLLPFAAEGRGRVLSDSSPDRVAWIADTPYGLTFVDYVDIPVGDDDGSVVRAASLYNRAGRLVEPSVAAIQLAMRDFSGDYAAGNLAIAIYDAPGNGSWPMAYVPLVALSNRFVQGDCTRITELVNFFAWVHTHDGATKAMAAINFAPLDQSLKKRVVDSLDAILCNYAPSFETDILVGYGAPLSVLTTWANQWSSPTTKAAYYETSSADAIGLQSDYGGDFGVTTLGANAPTVPTGLDQHDRRAAPEDMSVVPLAAFALAPAYNVPGLGDRTLALDTATIAGIYLGEVRAWDDPRIVATNAGVDLPPLPIVVLAHAIDSDTNWLLTSWLSDRVPSFAGAVGRSRLPHYPVQAMVNASVDVDALFGVGDALFVHEGAFAMWPQFDLGLISRIDTVRAASLVDAASGSVVAPTIGSVTAALDAYVSANGVAALAAVDTIVPVADADSAVAWPATVLVSAAYREATMPDCTKATALADFMWWTQSDAAALSSARRQGFAVATTANGRLAANMLDALERFECNGRKVSALAGCISSGTMCTNRGTCVPGTAGTNGRCVCDEGYEGDACEAEKASSDSDTSLVIALAVGLPTLTVVLAMAACAALVIALAIVYRGRRANGDSDWEISYDELEVGESLGSGGYGEVRRAVWKGTDVAVKSMSADRVTREMERNFCEEVRVMTSLRHPNVVLFMAACTKPPNMCIVMEYMALGSLYELLHNELIPELPFMLKAKMAYQASKGLYFLHSSGIVHRDVKSLNLLLDNKWNVKVSDFGLTKFRADLADGVGTAAPIGSVHWMAPEVLDESLDVDYAMADVYSFGIILWEVLTREQPYAGMSPAAIAVAVIRDGARPRMPDEATMAAHPQAYVDLIHDCWHRDPTVRPTFMEIMTRLSAMHGESSSGVGVSSSGSSGNDSIPQAHSKAKRIDVTHHTGGSWTLPSNSSATGTGDYDTGSSTSATGRSARADALVNGTAAVGGIRPPEGTMAIVFADVARAVTLWEHDPEAMRDATMAYNETLRSLLPAHRGYESLLAVGARSIGEGARNTGEGSFCLAFERVADAVAWCAAAQRALLEVPWPRVLLDHPAAAEEWGGADDRVLFCGPRARMGVHVGAPRVSRDATTKRVAYVGPAVDAAARITALAHGGQVVLSAAAYKALADETDAGGAHHWTTRRVGRIDLPDNASSIHTAIYELAVPRLEGRFFGAGTLADSAASSDRDQSSRSRVDGDATDEDLGLMVDGDEQRYLTSANMCRWVIDFGDVQLGAQVGVGSYGVVYRARWKGVDVAVKRFIRQQLDERTLLDFRAETALMLDLHHPNVVVFIGACVRRPNLCLVTEFIRGGNLRAMLADASVRIVWADRLRLMRTAAAGVAYLHGRDRPIVHRDLKSSNLLVDDNFTIKVADFGFARIREDNATMTRCGTPAWTAPEILRGERYSEKADIYSFGIVMWEIITRKQPYSGRNFMATTLAVLEGTRLDIPADCPADLAKLVRLCWHKKPAKRPSMDEVVAKLDAMGGNPDAHSLPV